MRKFIVGLFLYVFSFVAYAMPAYPGRIAVIEGDDTVSIYLRGDENIKYAIDDEGYTLLHTDSCWVYAVADGDGYAVPGKEGLFTHKGQFRKSANQRGLKPRRSLVQLRGNENQNYELSRRKPVIGNRRVLVILMEFTDLPFTKTADDFNALFNGKDYRIDGANGSVADYFNYVSYGQLSLKADILGPFTTLFPHRFYGENTSAGGGDANPYAMFKEALDQASKQVNLSDYDIDGDGYVDNIHIIYAGYGEEAGASSSAIWAHEMTFPEITCDGMKVSKYSCAPELRGYMGGGISRIGPHCHEIGHALGTMDFYDTDYSEGGEYPGTGNWDIMASGSWNDEGVNPANFNPYTKAYDFGWCVPQSLPADSAIVIGPSSEANRIYRIDTDVAGDYYLMENRQRQSTDCSIPGEGLLIFHIGPDIERFAEQNAINSRYPQQCYPVCASSTYASPFQSAKSYGEINSAGCPFPGSSGNSVFSSASTPAALTFSGRDTQIDLHDIKQIGENICLVNGSAPISFPGDDDPVITPDDPDDDLALWREGFDSDTWKGLWEKTKVRGSSTIETCLKLDNNDNSQSPASVSGSGYIKHSLSPGIMASSAPICAKLALKEQLEITAGEYVLTLYAREYRPYAVDVPAIVELEVTTDLGQIFSTSAIIKPENTWQKVSLHFAIEGSRRCCPAVIMTNSSSSTLFVDEVAVFKAEDTSINPLATSSVEEEFFDVFGRRIPRDDVRGIVIVRGVGTGVRKEVRY